MQQKGGKKKGEKHWETETNIKKNINKILYILKHLCILSLGVFFSYISIYFFLIYISCFNIEY